MFSFAGGDGINLGVSNPTIENLEGHITVNAASYVHSNDAKYQGDEAGSISDTGDGADFIGYTQTYRIRYTVNVTLKDGGLIKTTSESAALASYLDVSVENKHYRIYVDSVEPVETYENIPNIAFYRTPRNPDEGSLSMAKILRN